jgi:hypothetical protein
MSAFDDDLIAEQIKIAAACLHIHQHTKISKLTLAETRVGAGAAWSSISANTAGFLMEDERFILMLIIIVVVIVIVWVL